MPRFLLCLACFVLLAQPASAQSPAGRPTGIGGVIGDPSGLTLKHYTRRGFAYDLRVGYDLGDYLFLSVHGLYEKPLQGPPDRPRGTRLGYYYGPGLFLGSASETVVGVSLTGGVNLWVDPLEIFLDVTPRLRVLPDTDGDFGLNLGLRYYW